MREGAWHSCAEFAFFPRRGAAGGATDGEYLRLREFHDAAILRQTFRKGLCSFEQRVTFGWVNY